MVNVIKISLYVCVDLHRFLGAAKESNIIIHSILSAPQGINQIQQNYKDVTINTVAIDEKLNDKKYIVPGLGDYGDRFFGT